MVFHKRTSILLTALFVLLGCFIYTGNTPVTEAAASPYKNIVTPNTKTYIYIRKSKSMSSAKIGKFSKGDGATIVKKESTWYKIKSGDITGYVKKKNLLSGAKLESFAEKNNFSKKIKITARSLNVRAKASTSSSVVAGVNKDEIYSVISETKKWAKIKADGATGYVLKQYTTWSYDLGTAESYSSTTSSSTTSSSSSTTSSSAASASTYKDVAVCCVDSGKRLNIRAKASTSADVVGYMEPGASAKIVSKSGNWAKIQYGSSFGYIRDDLYYTGSKVESYANKLGLKKSVTLNANMNVRKKASTTSARLGGATKGSTYTLKKETAQWAAISFKGKTGYLKKTYLTIKYNFKNPVFYSVSKPAGDKNTGIAGNTSNSISTSVTGTAVANYAKQFLGNPYVYGGISLTDGCDCSGFTYSVYKHFGINIERGSYNQVKKGTAVSISNIQAGDLIFYAKNGTVYHVSLYLGNGKIIHAKGKAYGIVTDPLTYNSSRITKVVRMIPN